MSVATHIVEVLRQGIWASLTGGWYYDPGFSIFCNTVHVYIWLLLMLIPFVLGMCTSGSLSIPIAASYTGVVVFIFTVVKVITSYVHMIFDTTDPIVVTRTINDSMDEMYRDSEQQALDIEMIELRDMGFNMRGSERALDRERRETAGRDDRDSTAGVSSRRNRGSLSGSRSIGIGTSGTSSRRVRIEDEVVAKVVNPYYEEDDEKDKSLDEKDEVESPNVEQVQDELRFLESNSLYHQRRSSMPISLNSEERTFTISDKKWVSSPGRIHYRGHLSTSRIEGIVVKRVNEQQHVDSDVEDVVTSLTSASIRDVPSTSSASVSTIATRRRPSRRRSSTGTTTSSGGRRRQHKRAGSPAVFAGTLVKRDSQESSRSMPSSIGWTPVVVSLGDADRPTTSRYSADDAESGSDIKVEITKFLEELIDKHPETLDAIESVRMSRLGRIRTPLAILPPPTGLQISDGPSTSSHGEVRPQHAIDSGTSDRSSIFTVPAALRNAARRSGSFMDWHAHQQVASTSQHHIAQGHEDTTQGAVHSFQDEDGNWWTYTFDDSGVPGVGTAQPLGSGRAIMELLHREREKSGGGETSKKQFPAELEVLPESMYDSTDDEKEEEEEAEKDSDDDDDEGVKAIVEQQQPSTSREPIKLTRRERALSSSSNESCTYLPTLPSSVFHAPSGTGASRTTFNPNRGNQIVCFTNAASRLRNAIRTDREEGESMWQMEQIMELIESNHGARREPATSVTNRDRGDSLPVSVRNPQERFLSEVGFGNLPHSTPAAATPDFAHNRRTSNSNIRKSYYYQMKMFPKAQKSLNLKLDRPSVDRLFDRNRTIFSFVFDIFLAALVSVLAAAIINSNIYFDMGILFFAMIVSAAQFSLLKSVQPDASSPIHGFNWVVAYNRPIYFCICAGVILYLHYLGGGNIVDEEVVPWNLNPFRIPLMTWPAIIFAIRDFVSVMMLLMPIAFTVGWLPQVNTLLHHVLEQIEMHIFGGTASFGVLSAFIQIFKSLAAYGISCILCHLAYTFFPNSTQSPLFSTFIAITVASSYLLSRMSSNQHLTVVLFDLVSSPFCRRKTGENTADEEINAQVSKHEDEMPSAVRRTMSQRARYDLLFSTFLVLFFFALHSTSLFTATQPYFTQIIASICVTLGVLNHYLYPQLRSHTPWRAISQPILRIQEHGQYEAPDAAKLMVFEVVHMWMVAIERNIVYPLLVISMVTENSWAVPVPWLILPLVSIRILRGGFAQPQLMFLPIGFACLASAYDLRQFTSFERSFSTSNKPYTSWNMLPVIMFVCTAIYPKLVELYLKINFMMAYVAPWQISWGSAFHAFAQPFSLPHAALMATQTIISSIISAPLNPFLGSSFFTSSYVRPVKFWERDYNTKRADASNMRLASQIDRGPMIDDSNLNAVFYEHLTRSLQKSLAGDLAMGRWSTSVQPGDCFILASFYLNCLVHIIEVGNGFVTFQLRGLEFRGTYCHQREVEAISEDIRDGTGCCCCSPGSLPGFLSLNTAWGLRWLAWEVVAGKYIIDGYSISDNSAVNLLQVHELRRLLVTLYVKCIVHYLISSNKLKQWTEDEMVLAAIKTVSSSPKYTDLDSMFCTTNDEDYDSTEGGISRESFFTFYGSWMDYCLDKRAEQRPDEEMNRYNASCLCYLLSLVARRSLGTAAFNRHSNAAESFLYGLHALFKGDFRITCQRDEWVFTDMDLLRCVVAPAVKMALKLHQDHFAQFEEFDDHGSLSTAIENHQTRMFISHEQDPGWRSAILANIPSLLALRHVYDDGQDDYKIIMLNKMHLNMRVIKLNRECVRAFWAGQQQELIFLRNRNPERGSIQNARQVLRNMINSSADQPVGYPIYVSPLTTSHIESHAQIQRVFGPTFTFEGLREFGRNIWDGLRTHFGPSGSTSAHQASQQLQQIQMSSIVSALTTQPPTTGPQRANFSVGPPPGNEGSSESEEDREVAAITTNVRSLENSIVEMTKDGAARVSVLHRKDDGSGPSRPNLVNMLNSAQLGGGEMRDMCIGAWVQIVDQELIFKFLNEPLKSTNECLVVWPDDLLQHISGRHSWLYQPMKGLNGRIVYTWYPNHPIRAKRSHVGDHIHLIAVPSLTNGLIPIAEKGCRLLSPSECAMQLLMGSPVEAAEFQVRYNDALILAKVISGTVSSKTSFPKKPPIPPPQPLPVIETPLPLPEHQQQPGSSNNLS